ncbi:MAG: lipopolysaccharide heptosyltransferase II [Luteitalea sp.]|nr:lipopolysaccharide heptosyltransferase II [Luteitalea sp.]
MRLVVFAPNWLGDAVMSLPALADLRRAAPDAQIDVAARAAVAPLFTLVPGIQETITIQDRGEAVRRLRERRYDAALLLPNSFNAAFIARKAAIPERWGYRSDCRALLLSRAIAVPARLHQAEYYQHLTRRLGFASGPPEPRLEVRAELRDTAAALLTTAGWDGRRPLVACAPGAAYGGAKRWPAASFGELTGDLSGQGVTVVLIGSAADRAAGDQLLALLRPGTAALDLIGLTSLPDLAAVLTQCRALVTNDSGAMHLAAALGVSVTAMFGPTNERETRPLGPGRRIVLTHRVWCRPCMLRECPLTHRCMRGISVDAVREATQAAL